MSGIRYKTLEEVCANDLHDLITEHVRESIHMEYKSTLPGKKGPDPWMQGQNQIGDYAKNRILESVVAFANAQGGILLVGIEQSRIENAVAIAKSIQPLPRCEELASRFMLIFRDTVEPAIPSLEVKAILTSGDQGVLMIRTARSLNAPHRIKTTGLCTVRRQDRVDELSMWEIQHFNRNGNQHRARVKQILADRRQYFLKEFEKLDDPSQSAIGVRISGLPVDEHVSVEQLFVDNQISSDYSLPPYPFNRVDPRNYLINELNGVFRPILRGARKHTIFPGQPMDYFTYCEVYEDGLLEIGFLCKNARFEDVNGNIDPAWLVGLFTYMLTWICKVRRFTIPFNPTYEIEVEIHPQAESIRLGSNNEIVQFMEEEFQSMQGIDPRLRRCVFPTYSFSATDQLESVMYKFKRDLMNHLGLHP